MGAKHSPQLLSLGMSDRNSTAHFRWLLKQLPQRCHLPCQGPATCPLNCLPAQDTCPMYQPPPPMTKGGALSLQGLIGNSDDHTCTATMQGNCYTTARATAPTMPPTMPHSPTTSPLPHVPTSPSHDKGKSPELTGPDRELGRSHLHCDNARQLLHTCSRNCSNNAT